MTYKTKGTCSQMIEFEITDGKVHNVKFTGGCNGNLKGIGLWRAWMQRKLSSGWKAQRADSRAHPARISLHRH
jgi:hypothetical protein